MIILRPRFVRRLKIDGRLDVLWVINESGSSNSVEDLQRWTDSVMRGLRDAGRSGFLEYFWIVRLVGRVITVDHGNRRFSGARERLQRARRMDENG